MSGLLLQTRKAGFSLVEVVIALAVIGIALAGLAATQITAVRNGATSRGVTVAKAEANIRLEELATQILDVQLASESPPFDDDGKGNRYWFIDYFWGCPTKLAPENTRSENINNLADVECTGNQTTSPDGDVTTAWSIAGESGVRGEGVLTIAVTSTHEASGATVTVGTSITCFEVYPAPTSTAPAPCPEPEAAGGGRG